jgi:hypothetical protein
MAMELWALYLPNGGRHIDGDQRQNRLIFQGERLRGP